MSRIELRGVSRTFNGGAVRAVDEVDVVVDDGEFLVLLGPSGCGKTTLLRCLAGLDRPDSGRMAIGDDVVFDSATARAVPPYKRDIGMVFQNYSLWPHMTVERNVAYPLASRRVPRTEQRRRARTALELVECRELAGRLPAALSGGQQQRVALARAVVAEPRLMLFDEPLSNLDYRLRAQLREEIRGVHHRLGFTALYVTHDQTEALQLGTRVAVMRQGRMEQLDTPEAVFSSPATTYVADFLGVRNRIELRVADGHPTVGPDRIPVDLRPAAPVPGEYVLYLRDADVTLLRPAADWAAGGPVTRIADGKVVDVLYGGERCDWVVDVAGVRLHATAPTGSWDHAVGDSVDIAVRRDRILLYGTDGRLVTAT